MSQHNESLETALFYDCSLSEDGKQQLLEAYERVRVWMGESTVSIIHTDTLTSSPHPQDIGRFINDVDISLQ